MKFLRSKKSKKFNISLIVAFAVIILSLFWILKFSKSTENWQNYWTAVPPIIAIIISVGVAFFQMDADNEQKNKEKAERKAEKEKEQHARAIEKEKEKAYRKAEKLKEERIRANEKENDKIDREIENFNEKVVLARERAVGPLTDVYYRIQNESLELNLNDELFKSIVKIFYQYENVDKYRDKIQVDSAKKEDLLNQQLLRDIINNEKFIDTKSKIIECFPELENFVKTISNSSDDISNDNSLKKLEDGGNLALHNYILGDWVINRKNAEKVKILIGLSMDKKIISIYLIKKFDHLETSNRIRFKEKAILYDYSDSDALKDFNDFFEDWTAQNPVMYLNKWSKKTNEKRQPFKNVIEGLIKKENNSIPDMNDDYSILVVKTYKKYEFKKDE
ncbi:hypothetical protein [Fructilactobacillus frigidiflavus]|uniref:hypothetical protein n=1 Tax=Fructilactobacillus frigidiflavus TaxID=3242688 RepID=UPI003757E092